MVQINYFTGPNSKIKGVERKEPYLSLDFKLVEFIEIQLSRPICTTGPWYCPFTFLSFQSSEVEQITRIKQPFHKKSKQGKLDVAAGLSLRVRATILARYHTTASIKDCAEEPIPILLLLRQMHAFPLHVIVLSLLCDCDRKTKHAIQVKG